MENIYETIPETNVIYESPLETSSSLGKAFTNRSLDGNDLSAVNYYVTSTTNARSCSGSPRKKSLIKSPPDPTGHQRRGKRRSLPAGPNPIYYGEDDDKFENSFTAPKLAKVVLSPNKRRFTSCTNNGTSTEKGFTPDPTRNNSHFKDEDSYAKFCEIIKAPSPVACDTTSNNIKDTTNSWMNSTTTKFSNAISEIDELLKLFSDPEMNRIELTSVQDSHSPKDEHNLIKGLTSPKSYLTRSELPRTLPSSYFPYFGRDHWILTTHHLILGNYVSFERPRIMKQSQDRIFTKNDCTTDQGIDNSVEFNFEIPPALEIINFPDIWLQEYEPISQTFTDVPNEEVSLAEYFKDSTSTDGIKFEKMASEAFENSDINRRRPFFTYEFTTPKTNHSKELFQKTHSSYTIPIEIANNNTYVACTLHNFSSICKDSGAATYRFLLAYPQGIQASEPFTIQNSHQQPPLTKDEILRPDNFTFKFSSSNLSDGCRRPLNNTDLENFVETNAEYQINLPIYRQPRRHLKFNSPEPPLEQLKENWEAMRLPKLYWYKDGYRLDRSLFDDHRDTKCVQQFMLNDTVTRQPPQKRGAGGFKSMRGYKEAANYNQEFAARYEIYKPRNTFFVRKHFESYTGDYICFIADRHLSGHAWPNSRFSHLAFFRLYQSCIKGFTENEAALCFDRLLIPDQLGTVEQFVEPNKAVLLPVINDKIFVPEYPYEENDDDSECRRTETDQFPDDEIIKESVLTRLLVIADQPVEPLVDAFNNYDYTTVSVDGYSNFSDRDHTAVANDSFYLGSMDQNTDNISLLSSIPSDVFTLQLPSSFGTNKLAKNKIYFDGLKIEESVDEIDELSTSSPIEICRLQTPVVFPNPPTTEDIFRNLTAVATVAPNNSSKPSRKNGNKNYSYCSYTSCWDKRGANHFKNAPLTEYNTASFVSSSPKTTDNNLSSPSKASPLKEDLIVIPNITEMSSPPSPPQHYYSSGGEFSNDAGDLNLFSCPVPLDNDDDDDNIEEKIKEKRKENLNVIYSSRSNSSTSSSTTHNNGLKQLTTESVDEKGGEPSNNIQPSQENNPNGKTECSESIKSPKTTLFKTIKQHGSGSNATSSTCILNASTTSSTISSNNSNDSNNNTGNHPSNDKFNKVRARFENASTSVNCDTANFGIKRGTVVSPVTADNLITFMIDSVRPGSVNNKSSNRSSSIISSGYYQPPSSVLSSTLPDEYLILLTDEEDHCEDRKSIATPTAATTNLASLINRSSDCRDIPPSIVMSLNRSLNEAGNGDDNIDDIYTRSLAKRFLTKPSCYFKENKNVHAKSLHQAVKWKRPSVPPPTPPFYAFPATDASALGAPLTHNNNSTLPSCEKWKESNGARYTSTPKPSNHKKGSLTTNSNYDTSINVSCPDQLSHRPKSPLKHQKTKILLTSRHSLPTTTPTTSAVTSIKSVITGNHQNNLFPSPSNYHATMGATTQHCSSTGELDSIFLQRSRKSENGLNASSRSVVIAADSHNFNQNNNVVYFNSQSKGDGNNINFSSPGQHTIGNSGNGNVKGIPKITEKLQNSMQKCKIYVHNL